MADAIIDREILTGVDITSDTVVLTYFHPVDAKGIMVLPRVEATLIAGGGTYEVTAKVDGSSVTPLSAIAVPPNQTSVVLQGRHLTIEPGETVTIHLKGTTRDSAVDTNTGLWDSTPIRQSEFDEIIEDIEDAIGTTGPIEVDHNYGGADNYAYQTEAGAGVVGATIIAYRAEDYNADRKGYEYSVGVVTTDSAGRWRRSLMMDPGDYVLFYFKTGEYGPDTANLTVTAA
jgi:hypothetical protein